MKYLDLVIRMRDIVLRYRNTLTFCTSSEFIEMWGKLDEKEQEACLKKLESGCKDLMAEAGTKFLYTMCRDQLRRLARDLRIPFYSRMTRLELIEEVSHVQEARNGKAAKAPSGVRSADQVGEVRKDVPTSISGGTVISTDRGSYIIFGGGS